VITRQDVPCGVIVPLVTPLTENGDTDPDAIRRLVEHILAGGVAGILSLGTTGEFAALSREERRAVAAATIRAVAGRVPVFVNVAAESMRLALALAEDAALEGADAVVANPPSYYAYSDAETAAHFRALADEAPVPLVLYNIPQRTRNAIPDTLYAELAAHPRILAAKDSRMETDAVLATLAALRQSEAGRSLPFFVGDERHVGRVTMAGGAGGVHGLANIAPRLCVELVAAARWGDSDTVTDLQSRLLRLRDIFALGAAGASSAIVAPLKAILAHQGLCGPTLHAPASTLSPAHAAEAVAVWREAAEDSPA
jgi:2-dehydro-3-deoxy-D-pentonate aldolase